MDSIFYQSVDKYYPELHEILLANPGMLIALPQDCSMRNVVVSKSLIRAHVLKRNPSIKNAQSPDSFTTTEWYLTLCGKCAQLILRRDPITGELTRHLSVGSTPPQTRTHTHFPFSETRKVEVIDDEMCYGEHTESFTAFILERPLMGRGDVPRLQDNKTPLYDNDRLASQWRNVLEEYAKKDSVVNNVLKRCLKLATKIPQVFANVETADDVADAAEDLHDASENLTKVLATSKTFVHAAHVPRLFSLATEAVESIICSASYSDTFGIYCHRLSKPENILMSELFSQRERGWRPKELQGDLAHIKLVKSVQHMYALNDARSPMAKLQCIHSVIRSIMEDVSDHSIEALAIAATTKKKITEMGKKSGLFEDDLDGNDGEQKERGEDNKEDKGRSTSESTSTTVIAADELLPLLITTICEAALPCLLANTLYMREMSSHQLREGKLGYSLAMFEAAVAFIGRRVWNVIKEDLGDRDFGVDCCDSTFDIEGKDDDDDICSRKGSLDSSLLYQKLLKTTDREDEKIDERKEVPTTDVEINNVIEQVMQDVVRVVEVDESMDPLGGLETRKRAVTIGN
tara:strand:- start:31 stop:1752 length:1722 start_codon:yes stop_codon:yes gene_type:complete